MGNMSWSKRRGKVCSASEICGGAMPCRYRLGGKLAPVALTNSSAEKCSTSFSTDIAVLPSLTKGEPARPIRLSDPTCPFHASPLSLALPAPCHPRKMRKNQSGGARSSNPPQKPDQQGAGFNAATLIYRPRYPAAQSGSRVRRVRRRLLNCRHEVDNLTKRAKSSCPHAAMRNCVSCIWRGESDHEHASSMASSVLFQVAPVCRVLGGIPGPRRVRSWKGEGRGWGERE